MCESYDVLKFSVRAEHLRTQSRFKSAPGSFHVAVPLLHGKPEKHKEYIPSTCQHGKAKGARQSANTPQLENRAAVNWLKWASLCEMQAAKRGVSRTISWFRVFLRSARGVGLSWLTWTSCNSNIKLIFHVLKNTFMLECFCAVSCEGGL